MIEETYFYVIVGLLCLGTFAIRVSFIAFSGVFRVSGRVRALFTFIPAAIFPALILPPIFFHQGQVSWLGGRERLLVLVAAGILCAFYRSTLVVIFFGLLALFFLTQVL